MTYLHGKEVNKKTMAVNFLRQVVWLRQELVRTIKETNPTKTLIPVLLLTMLDLHMTEQELRKTNDVNERRKLTHDFNTRKHSIEGAIRALRKRAYPNADIQQGLCRRALP